MGMAYHRHQLARVLAEQGQEAYEEALYEVRYNEMMDNYEPPEDE